MELIVEPHRNVTVVGDDDQAIYRFRGAAIGNILAFRDRYRDARMVVLRRNYRSRAGILDASHRLIRFNDPDRLEVRAGIDKRLRPQRPEPRPGQRVPAVRHEAFATGSDEADWIAREIAGRVARGARPRDHAVLVRANAEADPILRSLNVAGVPWRFSGASGLYARPEIRLLLAFLRAVADLDSSVDVYALAASEVYGLGRRGPDRHRRQRPAAEPLDLGGARGARPTAGPPARLAGHPGAGSSRLVADLRGVGRARPPPAGRRGPLRVPQGDRASSPGWPRRTRRVPRRRSRTSPASSRSSGRARPSSPTTGWPSSSVTSRPSSRPATIRRPPTSTTTSTPSPCSRSTRPRASSSRSSSWPGSSTGGSRRPTGGTRWRSPVSSSRRASSKATLTCTRSGGSSTSR